MTIPVRTRATTGRRGASSCAAAEAEIPHASREPIRRRAQVGPILLLALCTGQVSLASPPVDVLSIANEGFLLQAGDDKVLIDALFLPEEGVEFGYDHPSAAQIEAMIAGDEPFERVNWVLVTHADRDHFRPDLVVRFLIGHPESRLIATEEAVAEMRAIAVFDSIVEQIEPLELGWEQSSRLVSDELELVIHRTRHSAGRSVQNNLYVLRLGGLAILHEGDAARRRETFEELGLERLGIDLAFLHDWYLLDEPGREVLQRWIRPRQVVVMHLPEIAVPYVQEALVTVRSELEEALPPARFFEGSMKTFGVPWTASSTTGDSESLAEESPGGP